MTSSGTCPFCAQSVSEELLLFGGPCPKCFAAIPGEEVATDPGVIVRAEQAEGDRRRARWKTLVPVVVGVPFLIGVAGVALVLAFTNQDPVLEPLEFAEEEDLYADVVVEAPPEPKPGTAGPKSTRPRPKPAKSGLTAPQPVPGGTAGNGSTPSTQRKVGGVVFNEPTVTVDRQGAELCEPDQISNMVKKAMGRQAASLTGCYNAALARRADLSGRWKAHFVINKAGRATQVSFTGRTMTDATMESCLTHKVAGWKFGRICSTQEVRKTWRFGRK